MKKVVFLLSVVTAFCWSCDLQNLEDPIIVGNVEDEIFLDIFEELALPNRGFTLRMETIELEDCLNATIHSTFSRQPARMNLDILEVMPPGECELGLAPAQGTEHVGIIGNSNYAFQVNIRNVVDNEGLLEVTPDAIRLSFPSENGFRLRTPELLRIPTDLIWGYVILPPGGNQSRIDEIINEIGAISSFHALQEGYYGYFQVNDQDDISIREKVPHSSHVTFCFRYDGSTSELTEKLAFLRAQAQYEDYPIFLLNQKGQEL